MAARVPVEERLFSLVLALLATETGLTKHDILSTVQGYRQRYAQGGDNGNLERQFERDKDDIRELGVPLETVEDPTDPGNNQLMRYRIPRGAYELPEDIGFSAQETALLGLASTVWREGAISGESRRALIKLRGIGDTGAPPVAYLPRVRLRDDAFGPLREALDRGLVARFAYLNPGRAEAMDREVVPLALVNYEGRWHLSAEELASGERKTFLLRRIVGPVRHGRAAPARPGDHGAEALAELEQVSRRNRAVVEVVPGSDAALRLARRKGAETGGDGALRFHFVDLHILADDLATFGPEVVVREPRALRDAVVDRLERIVADHG